MKTVYVKETMIPIANYVTVTEKDSLIEVMQALESARQENAHAHRDAIVVDESGRFIGKVTMIDLFRALEPNYQKFSGGDTSGTLTSGFVLKAVREFNLWLEPEQSICERAKRKSVADVMHVPRRVEYLDEKDTLEKALNLYVMGVHQPLIVKAGETVTGVLRFGDVFEVVRTSLLACSMEECQDG